MAIFSGTLEASLLPFIEAGIAVIVGIGAGRVLGRALTNDGYRRELAEQERKIQQLQNLDEPELIAYYRSEFGTKPPPSHHDDVVQEPRRKVA